MAGTLPGLTLSQQFDANGRPLAGALLYLYVIGTIAQPQNAFQDVALTLPLPWPVTADQNGRIPMFYVADGSIHARLTDANGSVQVDVPAMLVVGPSGGSTPGPGVDPTTIFSSGDIKFRPTSETLSGWVKLNGLTIGSATSGATQRANADTQGLFIYVWTNFTDAKCPVVGGRGATALADFNANKQITLLDWRGKGPKGLDDMGAAAAGRFTGVPFTGGDTATTPAGLGGENAHTITLAEAPAGQITLNDPTHSHGPGSGAAILTTAGGAVWQSGFNGTASGTTAAASTGITLIDHAGGGAHNNAELFALGTWYMRL